MGRLPVIYYDNPILRKKCAPIETITPEIRQLAQDMLETVDTSDAIGIAAPQVGHSIRLFVCRFYLITEEGQFTITPESYVFINPKITILNRDTEIHDEGCLSLPGFRVPVARPLKVAIDALDIEGKAFHLEHEGYNARVMLHENDHLNGVLHIDRTDPASRRRIEPFLHAIKKKHPYT